MVNVKDEQVLFASTCQNKKLSEDFFLGCFETVGPYVHGLYKHVWLIKPVYRQKKRKTLGKAKKTIENSDSTVLWKSLIIWHRNIFGKCLRKVSRMWPMVLSRVATFLGHGAQH